MLLKKCIKSGPEKLNLYKNIKSEINELERGRLKEGKIKIEVGPEWSKNKTGKDSFGRWIGVVYVDGVNINAELVEKGHAEKYEEGEG